MLGFTKREANLRAQGPIALLCRDGHVGLYVTLYVLPSNELVNAIEDARHSIRLKTSKLGSYYTLLHQLKKNFFYCGKYSGSLKNHLSGSST